MNCQVEIKDTIGPLGKVSEKELTVGRPFVLHCEGEWPELNAEKLELRLDAADQRKLKILKFQKNSSSDAMLLVTSYQPGEHQLKAVQLVDADHSVVLGDLQFTVKSVINPQEPPKEPYGPMGPVEFGIPLWFWLSIGFFAAVVGALVWWKIARRARRKKWMLEMKLHERALSPMADLGKTLRLILKDLSKGKAHVQELRQAYFYYLARVFQIPTLKMKNGQILNDIKAAQRSLYDDQGAVIMKAMTELDRALATAGDVSEKDLEQLVHLVRRSAEAIDRVQRKEAR